MNVDVLEALIEYKFAPGPLIAVQGFANTHSYENDEELLADPAASAAWLVEAGLLQAGVEVSSAEYEELLALRGAIRGLLRANHDDECDSESSATLGRLAREHPVGFTLNENGVLALDLEPAGSSGQLISQLLGIIASSQERNEWCRLKICPASDCRWAFYDTSKNRGGTWCRMEICGNRSKNRRYREKSAK